MQEKWSNKYKKSIDCDNPKGFSQRAHCQGKKKTFKEMREYAMTRGFAIGPTDTQKPMASLGGGQFFPNRKYATTLPALSATYQGPGLGTYQPINAVSDKLKLKVLARKIQKLKDKAFKRTFSSLKSPLFASKKSDELEHMKLMTKAFKTMPGSQKQSEIKKQINVIRKRLGLRPISESEIHR